ncbi:EmrB/QacA subfamily drug resistance transporter [Motilibacter peucedani]|uniref:EmrB/QacA subfamily drug resistance transporter n=1 Tax=Motilibacter peucedani TaxID=598650 RepID=A0A420XQI6_9ACTN|nr:DHA2 family efflux MFS transporter permease subunit [Motilibacter peucedani]RKS75476.1 EmrB/QacA subfamily drug resistance transporter [Motilibacter peucedani]
MTAQSTERAESRPGAPGSTPSSGVPASRWLVLVVLSLAQLMVVLDATIVNIALPTAQHALGFSDDARQWVVTGYALAFGSLLLLGGRLADLFGRRRMFIIGLVGFALASALGGAAEGFSTLLAARALQGVFGAALAPAALSLLSTTFTDPAERGKAFGIYGAIAGGGGAVGLLLGGLLTEYASWRWCLYVNLVIAAVALAGALLWMREGERPARPQLDVRGAATAFVGLVALVYGLANAESHGWTDVLTLGPIVVGLAVLAVFVLVERTAEHPLLPLRVVLDGNRGGAYLSASIAGAGMFGLFLFLTYYLTATLGFSPVATGAAFLPMIASIMVSATAAGSFLVVRTGPRPLVPTGALVAAVGMVLLTRLDLDSSYAADVLPALLVIGVGLGFVFAPVQNAATSGIQHDDAGVASAMINTTQQIGGSIGTALLSSFAASAASGYAEDHAAAADVAARAALASYHTVFWWSAGLFVVAAVVAAVLFRSGPLELDPGLDPVVAH